MNSNDLEKEYKKHNEKWAQDMKILTDRLIQEMNNTPVKVVRNSILESFDSDVYHDRRFGFIVGASKIVGSRYVFGTGGNPFDLNDENADVNKEDEIGGKKPKTRKK